MKEQVSWVFEIAQEMCLRLMKIEEMTYRL